MYQSVCLSILTIALFVPVSTTFADHGGDHLIPNYPGRCWRVVYRDFEIKGNLDAAFSFKMISVGGTGETDDIINYELKIKENYVLNEGWDESKTRVYAGSGLIKTISKGRVRFEIYIDLGNGGDPLTVQGYYHPGAGAGDYDDRVILSLPNEVTQNATELDDCCEGLAEGDDLTG